MSIIYSNRLFAPLLIGAVLAIGCGGSDTAPGASPQPARDIALTPTPAVQPQLNDVPAKPEAAPAPAARKPAPKKAPRVAEPAASPIVRELPSAAAPAAPAPAAAPFIPMGTLAAGTPMAVHANGRICTNTHKVGDRFTTTLRDPVTGSNGASIPAGSTVVFRVLESSKSEHSKDNIRLTYDVVSVKVGDESYTAEATVPQPPPIEAVRVQSTTDQAKKVGAGAAIGAIAGQIFGHNTRSTVIGAVVGGAAGGAVAAGSTSYDGCIPSEAIITATLNAPLKVKVSTRTP